jgi:LuxR family maltose regulon positive regulatory protein
VADYLMQEVYQNLPAVDQEFVLSTSFLGRLTGSLCDAVTETANSAAILEQLVRENLFMVPLEQKGEPPWYRYHALFAESMQALARTLLGETRLAAILEKASGWYAEHGLSEEAIQTALAARLYPRALSLIEGYLLIHDVSEMRTLARWLEGIPGHDLSTHPEICFAYAQVLLFSSPERFAPATAARMEPYAAAAETAWREQSNRARLGALLSFRGIVSWWQGDLGKAFQYARRSLEDLPESEVFWRGNSLLIASQEALNAGRIFAAQDTVLEARALLGAAQNKFGVLAALQLFGECLYWQGDLDQVEAVNQQILTEAVGDESMLDDQGLACLALANTAYERNDLSQAEQFASRSLDLAGQRGNELLRMQASLVQASVEAARGDYTAADSRFKNLAAGAQNPRSLREIREAQSRLALQAGEHPASSGGLSRISLDKGDAPAVLLEREDFTRARLHIARGESAAALEILKGRAAVAAGSGRLRSQVKALALEALAQHAEAGLPQVAKPLVEALQIGQARGFHRLFLDEGRPMSALLQAVLPTLGSRLLSLYATALVHSFDTEMPARPGEPALVEPLSPQEVRVLRLLAAGLSNIDIARELFVSTNTIKTHVKNIYRKLDVRSRGEARALARELKIM